MSTSPPPPERPDREGVLRDVLEALPHPAFAVGAGGRIGSGNDAWHALFHGTRRDDATLRVHDLVADPDARDRLERSIRSGERIEGLEVEMERGDGTRFLARLDLGPVDREGASALGVVRDVTEEARIRARLADTEGRYRSLIENSPDAFYECDLEGRFVRVNAAAEEIVGYGRDELLGRRFDTLLAPGEEERGEEIFRSVRTGEPRSYELAVVRKDGERIQLSGMSMPILAGERLVGIHGVVRDVTDQRRAEAELRERWESYRSLFDSVSEAIFIHDEEGRFLDVNRAAEEMYGYSTGELLGRTPEMLASPDRDDVPNPLELLARARAGMPQHFSWWGRRKDGTTFPSEVSLSRGRYFGRDVVIAVARDVTQDRRMERRLRQGQKMEAVGRLAGGIAHDFNNVLTVMQGHCELALQSAGDHPLRSDLEEIRSSAERAARLTRQLLAFSRRQMLQPELLDPAAVLAELRSMLKRLIGEHIELVFELNEDAPPIEVDRSQLEQVVVNLTLNARDAMPEGGRLEVILDGYVVDRREADAREYDIATGRWTRLRVRDNGTGMDEETVRRVFEPFFTTKRKGEGTGLGLATVYGIVKQSGGFIEVASAPGVGTTFEVLLPTAGRELPTDRDPSGERSDPEPPGPGGGTVLLCEDEGPVRALMRTVLTRHGYEVIDAGRGEEALDRIEGRAHEIDLLITDLVMPGMSGRELVERVKERAPDVRVLVISGYSEDEVRGDHGVAAPLLSKPFGPSELVETVRAILSVGPAPEDTDADGLRVGESP